MKRFLPNMFAAAVVMLVAATGANAAPDGYTHVLSKVERMTVADEQVSLPLEIWINPRFGEGTASFDLWVDADLTDFQAKVQNILGGTMQAQTCGDRVHVSHVNLTPREDKAQICARVYHERWQCIHAMVPKVNGFKITMRRTLTAKTRLVKQTASVCADLWPQVDPEGDGVRLDGRVTRSSVSRSGLFGDIFNARGQLRSRLYSEINRTMSDVKVLVPEALQPFDPVVKKAEFTTREDGSLGLVTTMEVQVMPDDVPAILALMAME